MKVTLNRNGWHRRLQKYVLNVKPSSYDDLPNLCPYFWLTIFCLLVVPFVWLAKCPVYYLGVALVTIINGWLWIVDKLVDLIGGPIEAYICKPVDRAFVENYVKNLTPEEIVSLYDRRWTKGKPSKLLSRWMVLMGDGASGLICKYREEVEEARQKAKLTALQRQREAADAIREARKARQRRHMQIANATKFLAPLLLLLLVVPLLGGLGWGLYKLYLLIYGAAIPWMKILCAIGLIVGGCIALLVTFAAGILLWECGGSFFRKCCLFVTIPFRLEIIVHPFIVLGRGLRYGAVGMAEGIAGFVEFFVEYAKAAKKDYCPQIDWKDK